MAQRVIPCRVLDDYITGDGVTIGGAGSHDEVLLELDFRAADAVWAGTTRTVTFTNALGLDPVNVLLTTNLLSEGQTEVYRVPVPVRCKAYPGWISVTVSGVEVFGDQELLRIATGDARFRVLDNVLHRWEGSEDVPPSATEQLQAEIDGIKDPMTGVVARAKTEADRAEAAADEAEQHTLAHVADWLEKHPEATTTVQDGAISERKLAPDLYHDHLNYEINSFRYLDTSCVIVTIPKTANNGYANRWRLGFAHDMVGHKNSGWDAGPAGTEGVTLPSGERETVRDYAARHELKLATNGGYFNMPINKAQEVNAGGSLGWWPDGITIRDGVYIGTEPYKYYGQDNGHGGVKEDAQTLAIMEDGSFRYYDNSTLVTRMEAWKAQHPQQTGETDDAYETRAGAGIAEEMISNGVRQTLTAHFAIVSGGENRTGGTGRRGNSVSAVKAIGYDESNYYLFASAHTWEGEEAGLTLADVAELLTSTDEDTAALRGTDVWAEAYATDGGGSTSIDVIGVKVNKNKDDKGGEDRAVGTILYLAGGKDNEPIKIGTHDDMVGTILSSQVHEIRRLEKLVRISASGIGDYLVETDENGDYIDVDINDPEYRVAGVWHIRNATEAAHVVHLPLTVGGRLEALYMTGPTFALQRFYPRTSAFADRICLVRRFNGLNPEGEQWGLWILMGGQIKGDFIPANSTKVEIEAGGYVVSEMMVSIDVRFKALTAFGDPPAGNITTLALKLPDNTQNMVALESSNMAPLNGINITKGTTILATAHGGGGVRIGPCDAGDVISVAGSYPIVRNYNQ